MGCIFCIFRYCIQDTPQPWYLLAKASKWEDSWTWCSLHFGSQSEFLFQVLEVLDCIEQLWSQLYKNRSSGKTDSQWEKRSSGSHILLKIVSENPFFIQLVPEVNTSTLVWSPGTGSGEDGKHSSRDVDWWEPVTGKWYDFADDI